MFGKIIQNFKRLFSYNPKAMSRPRTKECDTTTDELLRDAISKKRGTKPDNG